MMFWMIPLEQSCLVTGPQCVIWDIVQRLGRTSASTMLVFWHHFHGSNPEIACDFLYDYWFIGYSLSLSMVFLLRFPGFL